MHMKVIQKYRTFSFLPKKYQHSTQEFAYQNVNSLPRQQKWTAKVWQCDNLQQDYSFFFGTNEMDFFTLTTYTHRAKALFVETKEKEKLLNSSEIL